MNITKKKLFRIVFGLEVAAFIIFYSFGPDGLYSLSALHSEIRGVRGEIETLEKEIAVLRVQNKRLAETSFFKEKIAREQLQMAREGDRIYLID